MGDCYTFREELAIKYPTLGHALWEPDPGGLYRAVEVGDVGLIRRGRFHRLFNALLPRDHPSNSGPYDGPNYPEQLQPRIPNHINKSRDHQKDFRSKSVTKEAHGPNVFASGPDDDAPVTFSCSGTKGTLISLPILAQCEDTIALGDFSKWIVKNIDDCMRLAEDLGLGVNRMEDMILVTGRHLAKSWVNVAFSESRGGAQVSFGVRVSGVSGVHLEERNATGGELKLGPSGENLPENQCIFVRGYRVVRILNIWPRLRGLAEPAPDIHDPEPEFERLKLISIAADADDLLHVLLEYVAENAEPDCDLALVHDDDLKLISDLTPEILRLPSALKTCIKISAPKIHQVQCGLSPGSKSESGAKVAMTRVATLSKNVRDALRKDRDTSSSTSTFKATSQKYDYLRSNVLVKGRDISQQLEKQADTQAPLLQPQVSSGSSDPIFHLADIAYTKLVLHALKYPRQAVGGVLLGPNPSAGAPVEIIDAVPLYHWKDARPGTGIGPEKATNYARSRQLYVVGYYEVPVRFPVRAFQMEKSIMDKIDESFHTPIALMMNRDNLYGENDAALIPFVPSFYSDMFVRDVRGRLVFDRTIPKRTQDLIRRDNILDNFFDFEDFSHHDDDSFFTNDALEAALNSSQ